MTQPDAKDYLAALAKGVVGGVPYFGPVIAEVIDLHIPNRRLDRLNQWLEILAQKVKGIEEVRFRERLKAPEVQDLFVDGLGQASRSLSSERLQHLASVLANGISEAEVKHEQRKRVLRLLDQLSDQEVILLAAQEIHPREDPEFHKRHEDIIIGPDAQLGSPQEELDKLAVYESNKQSLQALGLLRDRSGVLEASGLGKLLLREIGLIE